MSASALLFVISLLTNRYKGKHLCVYMQTKITFFCIKNTDFKGETTSSY